MMTAALILPTVAVVLVGLAAAGGGGGGSGRSSDKHGPRAPERRAFLRAGLGLSALGAFGGFGAASLAFLWPDVRAGFGSIFDVDDEEAILSEIEANGRYAFPPGRALLVRYDAEDDPEGQYADITDGQRSRVMALYHTCPHLGCTVPWCDTSRWWECPCHGSRYNRWGEWMDGPAPRGMDRFRLEISEGGRLLLDTSEIVTGPSRQARVLDQPPEGASCV